MLTSLYRWYDPTGPTTPEQLERQIAMVLGALMPPGTWAADEPTGGDRQ